MRHTLFTTLGLLYGTALAFPASQNQVSNLNGTNPATEAPMGDKFLSSCWYVSAESDGGTAFNLQACCAKDGTTRVWGWLDLRSCLGTDGNGNLVPSLYGNFDKVCRNCNWFGGEKGVYGCYCDGWNSPPANNHYTEINLNGLISNVGGRMECANGQVWATLPPGVKRFC